MTEGKKAISKGKVTKKPKKENPLDRLKVEIAQELGLLEKVSEVGWGGLTAAESGRIGGIMTRRIRANESNKKSENVR